MTRFTFIEREWASVFETASMAEVSVNADPRTACYSAYRELELAVGREPDHDLTHSSPPSSTAPSRASWRPSLHFWINAP